MARIISDGHEGKKEIISFRKTISPITKVILSERVKSDGTIEEIRVRFYRGQEKDLHVRPFIKHKQGNAIEELFTYPSGTESYLSGDSDYFVFSMSVPIDYDDELMVEVENVDSTYNYDLVVDYVVDYLGGKVRVS